VPDEPTVADLADELVRLAGAETEAGRAALLTTALADLPAAAGPGAELRLLDAGPALLRAAEAWAAGSGSRPAVVPAVDDLLAFAEDWRDEWEVDRARQIVRERVLPALDPGRPAELLVMVSEPAPVRQALAAELMGLVSPAGQPGTELPPGSTVQVLSAFKPGLCWLREVVAPRWRDRGPLGGVARVEVRYRPLLPAEDAMDAADAGAGAGERTGRRLDLPIRWLQELFPGDEVLAAALGLPLDAVRMVEGEPGDGETYAATCWDAAGRELDRLAFSPRSYTRPYLEGLPEQGWVIATTGAVVAAQGGRTIVDEPLPTDVDHF
jgi:hypothetical protein